MIPPFMLPIAPKQPPVIKRYGASICTLCRLEVEPMQYCKGHTLPEMASSDGADSSLNQRIRDVQAKQ